MKLRYCGDIQEGKQGACILCIWNVTISVDSLFTLPSCGVDI